MQDIPSLQQEIRQLKEERNAILLVHNYQLPEIQDIADLTGDSLELSRAAATMEGDVIVFCGVDFMAETAAILSPEKTVLLPAEDACCPMAQMIIGRRAETRKGAAPGCCRGLLCQYFCGGQGRERYLLHLLERGEGGQCGRAGRDHLCAGPEPRHVCPAVHEEENPPVGRVLHRARPDHAGAGYRRHERPTRMRLSWCIPSAGRR